MADLIAPLVATFSIGVFVGTWVPSLLAHRARRSAGLHATAPERIISNVSTGPLDGQVGVWVTLTFTDGMQTLKMPPDSARQLADQLAAAAGRADEHNERR